MTKKWKTILKKRNYQCHIKHKNTVYIMIIAKNVFYHLSIQATLVIRVFSLTVRLFRAQRKFFKVKNLQSAHLLSEIFLKIKKDIKRFFCHTVLLCYGRFHYSWFFDRTDRLHDQYWFIFDCQTFQPIFSFCQGVKKQHLNCTIRNNYLCRYGGQQYWHSFVWNLFVTDKKSLIYYWRINYKKFNGKRRFRANK